MKRARAAFVVASCVAFAAPAFAADDATPRAMAESLFEEGRALLDAGKVEPACAKFAASQKLDPAPGTLLNLGDCYERLGRTATAWITFRDAEVEARRAGDDRRASAANTRAQALEPALSRVVIRAPSGIAGLRVTLDDVALPPASLGARVPLDPGAHRIHADAPGYAGWDGTLDAPPRSSTSTFAIPALVRVVVARPGPPFWSAPRTASVVTGAFALASAGVGIAFGLLAQAKWNDAKAVSSNELGHDAGTFADVSTVTFIAAGVLAATAFVLWVAAPSHAPRELAIRF